MCVCVCVCVCVCRCITSESNIMPNSVFRINIAQCITCGLIYLIFFMCG